MDALSAYSDAMTLNPNDPDLILSLEHLEKLMNRTVDAASGSGGNAEIDYKSAAPAEPPTQGIPSYPQEPSMSVIKPEGQVTPLWRKVALAPIKAFARHFQALGDAARDRGDWIAAASHYRTCLWYRPSHFAIWVQQGHALKESHRLTEALQSYERALRLNSTDADLLLNIGHLYKVINDKALAISFYNRSIECGDQYYARKEIEILENEINKCIDVHNPNGDEWASNSPIEQRRAITINDCEIRLNCERPAFLEPGPQISILTPVYNVDEIWLRRMVESVMRQTYTNWQLCLVDDGSLAQHIWPILSDLAESDERIVIARRLNNGGISAASNDALAMASGSYVALLDNDDMLTCDALEEMVKAINSNNSPDWLYSDEFKIDSNNRVSNLFSKPDWSPFYLLNYMYTGHLSLYKTSLVREIGGFRSDYDLSQDYDLALRVADSDPHVFHVEKYLYGWRMIEGSGAQGDKPQARITNIAALQDASDRRGWNGLALPLPTANRIQRSNAGADALFSIVIPSDDARNISITIKSICERSSYSRFEIIVVTNSTIVDQLKPLFEAAPVVWVRYDEPFNFSAKCNAGAAQSQGDYIAFFNDDVRVVTPDWMEALLEYLTLPGVGAVGPKLLYENGLIQHAGMVSGVRGLVGTAFHSYPGDSSIHFNMAQCVREVSLLCGALLAMPRAVFENIGGFDADNAPISHSDVDLCFRIREAGLNCIYTPYATLVHIGHMSLAVEEAKEAESNIRRKNKADPYILRRFGSLIARDPYFTPAMRDLIYIDSQEPFYCYPANRSEELSDAVIVSHDLTGSGAPKVVYDMATALQREGHFVVVVSPMDGPYRKALQAENITVIIDPLLLTGHDASMDLLRNFDMVIVNTIVGWRAVRALKEFTKVYWYTHETNLVYDWAGSQPDFCNLIGSGVNIWSGSARAADAMRCYGAVPLILEYGADEIEPLQLAKPITIAIFGSFEPRKGQDLAVLGMKLLPPDIRKRARLMLYGRTLDQHFRAEVVRLADDIEEIVFFGELSLDSYRDKIYSADIILVPSRDDALPLVSLDALALSKPLICTANTGTTAYLENGFSALVLEHGDPAEIAEHMKRLIQDEALRATIGQNGRRVFENWFTREAFETRLLGAIAARTKPALEPIR